MGQTGMTGKILALLFTVVMTGTAAAAKDNSENNFKSSGERVFASEFGPTLPPVGYVSFCARNAEECRSVGGRNVPVALTPERYNLFHQVNTFVNA
jgi:predicted transglutaminase-like cysteine proteinase